MLDDDVERRLHEWRDWYVLREAGGQIAITGAYDGLFSVDGYPESSTPIMFGPAVDTDNCIEKLPTDLRATLRSEYLRRGPKNEWLGELTQKQVANRHMGISQSTYERWLSEAKKRLKEELRYLRDSATAPYLQEMR